MKPKIKATCTKLQLQLLSFCLLCLTGKTRCDGNGPAVVKVEQGSDAVLPCSLSTKKNIESDLFGWRKAAQKDDGQKEVFYYDAGIHYNNGRAGQSEEFKGRVFHFPEELKHGKASIIIKNTKVTDSGNYTCDFPLLQPRQTFHIELVVGTAPKPVIRTLDQTDNRALLQCEVTGNPQPEVEWRDSAGNILHAEKPQVSERDGSLYITLNIAVTKTDRYRCVATQETISHQTSTEISVCISGAAPKPNIRTLDHTGNRALLQCEVHGNPQPEVEWRDSAGNKLPAEEPQVSQRDGRFFITLNTTVTETNIYQCVATQKNISHQIHDETFVLINGAAPKPNIRTLDHTGNRALLQCEVHGNPQPEVEWRDSAGNKLPAEKSLVSERDGRFYVTLNITVTETDIYQCVATQKNINHQIHDETFVLINGSPIVAVVVTFFVTLILVLVVLAVLVYKRRITLHCNKDSPADQNDGSAVPLKSQPSRSQEAPDPLT